MSKIYLDNAATTHLDPQVFLAMQKVIQRQWGNPSSVHTAGVRAAVEIEKSRASIASKLGAHPHEIHFTSGGTEANNLALLGTCHSTERGHLIVSAIEHASIREIALHLQQQGWDVTFLPVNQNGFISAASLQEAIKPHTRFVSIIHGNNETGALQDLRSLGLICRAHKIPFHTDACQSFLKSPLNVQDMFLDMVSLNAHKLHGPKGVGALYVRNGLTLRPLFHGGLQENGLRPGTLNTEAIVGFREAVQIYSSSENEQMFHLRKAVWLELLEQIPGVQLNGCIENSLCHILSITVPHWTGKELMFALDHKGISVSVGSACSSGKKTHSYVLEAMGRQPHEREMIRISLSKWTQAADLHTFVHTLKEITSRHQEESNELIG